VTAIVVTDSSERAAEIAWSGELRPGEKVSMSDAMECFDGEPEVTDVRTYGENDDDLNEGR